MIGLLRTYEEDGQTFVEFVDTEGTLRIRLKSPGGLKSLLIRAAQGARRMSETHGGLDENTPGIQLGMFDGSISVAYGPGKVFLTAIGGNADGQARLFSFSLPPDSAMSLMDSDSEDDFELILG